MKSDGSAAYTNAIKGFEELLKSSGHQNLWDIYCMQGFLGLTMAMNSVQDNTSKEIWAYIKQNKHDLKYYLTLPEDV